MSTILLDVPNTVGAIGLPTVDLGTNSALVRQVSVFGGDSAVDAFVLEGSPNGTDWALAVEDEPVFAGGGTTRPFNDNSRFYRARRTQGTTPLLAILQVSDPAAVSGTVTANQGDPAPVSSAWPIKVTDGVNVAGVAPAATAAVAGQPSLVVALSPNTPLPAGTNAIGSVTVSGGTISGTVDQGAPAAVASAWPIKVTDGVNVAAVKAAATAAVAADPSLVVALSPNTPLPAGGNALGSVSVSNFPATQPVSGTVTANQGTAAATAGAWPTKVTDGVNVAGVKAAATAAVAADPSLVVALSPNTPLPAGGNALGSVSVSNFPATQPVSGTVTANQGTAAATAGAWPTKVTDGVNVAAVKAAATAAVAADPSLVVALSPNTPLPAGGNALGSIENTAGTATAYSASSNGFVDTATAATTTTSIVYLFHPNTNAKRVKILRIVLSWSGNGGNNALSARGNFITAENGAPGGTLETIQAHDQADAASTLIFRAGATGAPTRVTGDLFSVAMIGGSAAEENLVLFDAGVLGKPLILRAGSNEGFEVRTVIGGSNLASAVHVGVYFTWTEE